MGEGLQGTSFLSFLSFFLFSFSLFPSFSLSPLPSGPFFLLSSAVFLSSFNIIF